VTAVNVSAAARERAAAAFQRPDKSSSITCSLKEEAIVRVITILSLPLGLVLLFAVHGIGQQENREFMRAKLRHSQQIVEGLALENFEQIVKNAQQLSRMSHATNWQAFQTEDYVMHSGEFRRAVESLRAQANKKNLEGAVLAYLDVTMKCVNCHKYMRGVRMAKHSPSGSAADRARRPTPVSHSMLR
jgi:hypothetical protein